jgi:hypothetical protein
MAPLAQAIAARTGAVVVAPSVSSWPWEPGGCWLVGEPLERAVASLFADRSALTASAHAAGWVGALPGPLVLAGHSAGGHLALEAAGDMVGSAGFADLRSVVLLDGGWTDGPPTPQELAALASLSGGNWRPVLQIASPNGVASDVTHALLASRPGQFVGVELKNGNHLDAVGYTNLLGNLVLGWPRPENVQAVQTIAADWIGDALTGSANGIVGGQPGQQIAVGAATAIVLG